MLRKAIRVHSRRPPTWPKDAQLATERKLQLPGAKTELKRARVSPQIKIAIPMHDPGSERRLRKSKLALGVWKEIADVAIRRV